MLDGVVFLGNAQLDDVLEQTGFLHVARGDRHLGHANAVVALAHGRLKALRCCRYTDDNGHGSATTKTVDEVGIDGGGAALAGGVSAQAAMCLVDKQIEIALGIFDGAIHDVPKHTARVCFATFGEQTVLAEKILAEEIDMTGFKHLV